MNRNPPHPRTMNASFASMYGSPGQHQRQFPNPHSLLQFPGPCHDGDVSVRTSGGVSSVLRQDHPVSSASSNVAPTLRHLPVSCISLNSHAHNRLTLPHIPRARINRLTSGSGAWLQGSNSSYSMGSGKSWGVRTETYIAEAVNPCPSPLFTHTLFIRFRFPVQ